MKGFALKVTGMGWGWGWLQMSVLGWELRRRDSADLRSMSGWRDLESNSRTVRKSPQIPWSRPGLREQRGWQGT